MVIETKDGCVHQGVTYHWSKVSRNQIGILARKPETKELYRIPWEKIKAIRNRSNLGGRI